MIRQAMATAAASPHLPHQLLRYLVVGAANTAFAYGLYALGLLAGLPFYLASLVALCVGLGVSYATQSRLVFQGAARGRLAAFVAMWALLYLVNIGLIALFAIAGLDAYWAGLAAIPPVTALAFVAQRQLVFATEVPWPRWRPTPLVTALGAALAALALMRAHMIFGLEANWDEFLNLSMVHDWSRGELTRVLQTAFVHLFGWVSAVSANELDQIVAARMLVAGFVVATSFCLFGMARRFMPVEAALFAVLAFNAFSYSFQHGISLRTDPLATAPMMGALWLAVAGRLDWRRGAAIGLLTALAGAMTIKAAIHLPILAALFAIRFRFEDARRLAGVVFAAAGAGVVSLMALLLAHAATLPEREATLAFVERATGATIARSDISVFQEFVLATLLRDGWFWLLVAVGVAAAAGAAIGRDRRRDGFMLLALALPLLTPLVYSETYPYFYPMALAPTAVLAGLGFARLVEMRGPLMAGAMLIAACAGLAMTYAELARRGPEAQRDVLALVHSTFPDPVPYVDSTSMVAAYPKHGLFMSRWGMRDYRAAGRPVMRDLLLAHQPRFLLDSRGSLDLDRIDPARSEQNPYGLIAADARTLQTSFVRHWGPLFVPGFNLHPGMSRRELLIGGVYRLEATSPVRIDGRSVAPGTPVPLAPGVHVFDAAGAAELRLDVRPPPAAAAPRRLFHGF